MTRLWTIIAMGLFLSWAAGLFPAAAQVQYVPTGESRVWIEGTSNVTDFTCTAQDFEGRAWLPESANGPNAPGPAAQQLALNTLPSNRPVLRVTVPVEDLDCGQARQNRDLRRAMKADEHPGITYVLRRADLISAADTTDAPLEIKAVGTLTIAGTSQTVEVMLEGYQQEDGTVAARGRTPLRMTDFDIDPPSALLGMIRVQDEIVVHFDITAVPARTRKK